MTKGSCIKDWGTLLALTELLLVTHLCSIDGTVSLELPSKMKLAAAKRFGFRTAGRETTAAVIGWHLLLYNKIPGHFSILVSNDSSCLSRVKDKKTEESKMKLVRSNRTNLTPRPIGVFGINAQMALQMVPLQPVIVHMGPGQSFLLFFWKTF